MALCCAQASGCNEAISLSHDPTPRLTEQTVNCRFKSRFPPLSNSREQEEANESGERRGGRTDLKHDAAVAAAAAAPAAPGAQEGRLHTEERARTRSEDARIRTVTRWSGSTLVPSPRRCRGTTRRS